MGMSKLCCLCKTEKEKLDFYFRGDGKGKDGLKSYCKKCSDKINKNYKQKNKEKILKYNRDLYKSDPKYKYIETREEYTLKSRYGINLKERKQKLEEQKGLCAICLNPEVLLENPYNKKHKVRKLNVDHSRLTGKVRGLLCVNCNLGLGNFKDNSGLLDRAIKYLRKYNSDTYLIKESQQLKEGDSNRDV